MTYIERKLQSRLLQVFGSASKKGVILAGIVGCGKTTLISEVLKRLTPQYRTFTFSGDDVTFRNAVNLDTTFIHKHVRSQSQGRALIFVDEVQKSEGIFDAVKYAFDHSDISFIISGSNPDYLNTTAKKRLQRRADFLILEPFSISELLAHIGYVKLRDADIFREILTTDHTKFLEHEIDLRLIHNKKIMADIQDYLTFGGLPLAVLSETKDEKLTEIRKVVERGFESLSVGNDVIADTIKVELAKLHSKEFTYQGIFQKTGIRRRDTVNHAIDELVNHGYLLRKKPYLECDSRRSYLTIFSYIDPGIVTYLTGTTPSNEILGSRVEGVVHASLSSAMANYIPLKSSLFYYKPYSIDVNDKVKFKEGEIDFIYQCGDHVAAIEVKATNNMNNIRAPLLEQFVADHKLPFGIVLYGGVPFWDRKVSKILYWPYWLI